MSDSLEQVKSLIKQVNSTTDFKSFEQELEDAITAVENDTSLLDMQKKPAITGGKKAKDKLQDRLLDVGALANTLRQACSQLYSLADKNIENICFWFFRIAYSGTQITPEMEDNFRPIVTKLPFINPPRFCCDKLTNVNKLDSTCQWHERFAKWNLDFELPIHNLEGVKITSRVVPLPDDFAQEIRNRADVALQSVRSRQKAFTTQEAMVTELLQKYEVIIGEAFKRHEVESSVRLERNDSFPLYVCLESMLTFIDENELQNGDAFLEKANDLRFKFSQVRFRSSSVIFEEFAIDTCK
ncbi:MAG TPA: hypothetical protein EYP59_11935 [Thiotrichaceae bacterium]|nr:hypothetical protein [Thiotrichaceae bacterium]